MNENNYVAIMAGGIGSRFWPVSRLNYPKQFIDLLNVGRTLIQSTYDRFAQYIPIENIYVVTSIQYKEIVESQLPQLKPENILCEPSRKNTAPCIAYISYKLNQLNPNSNLICAPADHLILDDTSFRKVSLEALEFTAKNSALITLGIKPFSPKTGYGYIQHEQHAVSDNVYVIPSDFGWSDLGTWGSAYENLEKDNLENAVAGNNVMLFDSTKNIVHSQNDKLILLQGLDDFIVVDTEDVLLICKKEKEQHIKEYVAEIKRNKGDKYL